MHVSEWPAVGRMYRIKSEGPLMSLSQKDSARDDHVNGCVSI